VKEQSTFLQKCLAWSVHIFTSLGIVAAFLALIATNNHDWRTAMFWLIVALVVDGVDGTIARYFEVKKNLPFIDGQNIDYVVDFVNYAFVPAYMFYEAGFVSDFWNLPLTCLILLVSALYYGRKKMVTDDNYFIGFPVLWNLTLFYFLFVTDYESIHYIWITILLAVLHFIPIKMAYPSRNNKMRIPSILMFSLFVVVMSFSVFCYPSKILWAQIGAYAVLIYFSLLALYDTYRTIKIS